MISFLFIGASLELLIIFLDLIIPSEGDNLSLCIGDSLLSFELFANPDSL